MWILGDRIDNRFRITDSSKNALIINVRQKGQTESGYLKKQVFLFIRAGNQIFLTP